MKRMPKTANCPTEFAMELLGGKWATVILARLKEEGPLRYRDLRRLIPKLTEKVLTQRLDDLQARGLVARSKAAGDGSRYALTAEARALRPALEHLYAWGEEQARRFGVTLDNLVGEEAEA